MGIFCLLTVLCLAGSAQAQVVIDVTWVGGTGNINDTKWEVDFTVISLDGLDRNLNIDGGKSVISVVNVNNNANHHDVNISVGDTLNVMNGRTLKLSSIGDVGSITNDGILSLSASAIDASTTSLEIKDGIFTVSGAGTITLSDSPKNRIVGDDSDAGLINASGHTIQGAGELGANALALTNAGAIVATGANPLIIDVTGTSFTNNGALLATGTGGLRIKDTTFTNSSLVAVSNGSRFTADGSFAQTRGGLLVVNAGGTAKATSFTIGEGSILGGGGTISGPVTNNGIISPGGAPTVGTLTFDSALTLSSTSLLHFELGGTSNYDLLIAPTVSLNGALMITFTNNFQNTVSAKDTFTLISTTNADGLHGLFASLPNGSILGTADGYGFFTVNYAANGLTISNFSPVPEPSTYALFGTGLLALVAFRRRRR